MRRPSVHTVGSRASAGRARCASRRAGAAGAGSWTHQNTDAANTLCSDDTIVRGPLDMLWYRDTDFVLPLRHGRGPAPLVDQGTHVRRRPTRCCARSTSTTAARFGIIRSRTCCCSYHREHSIGAAWTGGNYCLDGERLYVHAGDRCVLLDAATGRVAASSSRPCGPTASRAPGATSPPWRERSTARWPNEEYLVRCWSPKWDTGGQFIESVDAVRNGPASRARSGGRFTPEHSIRNNAIAVAGGRVYLIDRPMAEADRLRFPLPSSRPRRSAARRRTAPGLRTSCRGIAPQPSPGGWWPSMPPRAESSGSDEAGFGTQLAVSREHGARARVLPAGAPGQCSSPRWATAWRRSARPTARRSGTCRPSTSRGRSSTTARSTPSPAPGICSPASDCRSARAVLRLRHPGRLAQPAGVSLGDARLHRSHR